jgi:hypothetical protein
MAKVMTKTKVSPKIVTGAVILALAIGISFVGTSMLPAVSGTGSNPKTQPKPDLELREVKFIGIDTASGKPKFTFKFCNNGISLNKYHNVPSDPGSAFTLQWITYNAQGAESQKNATSMGGLGELADGACFDLTGGYDQTKTPPVVKGWTIPYMPAAQLAEYNNSVNGIKKISFKIDPDNSIVESNEQNNNFQCLNDSCYVLPPMAKFIGKVTLSNNDNGREVELNGNYAYVLGYKGLYIVNISTPSNPVIVGSYIIPSNNNTNDNLILVGNYAYFTVRSGVKSSLYIINVSNAGSPTLVTTYNPINSDNRLIASLAIKNNYLFMNINSNISQSEHGIYTIDISNPTNPKNVGVYKGFFTQSFILDNYLYTSLFKNGGNYLNILDVSNPASLVLKGEVIIFADSNSNQISDIVGANNHLYLSDNHPMQSELNIVNVTDKTKPVIAGKYISSEYTHAIYIYQKLLFATTGTGLYSGIFNIAQPISLAYINGIGWHAGDFFVVGNLVYMADGELAVYDISEFLR